jgi:hypothetical protein
MNLFEKNGKFLTRKESMFLLMIFNVSILTSVVGSTRNPVKVWKSRTSTFESRKRWRSQAMISESLTRLLPGLR